MRGRALPRRRHGGAGGGRLRDRAAGGDYVTVRDPASGKRRRLRGKIYERDWTPEPGGQPPAPHPGGPGADGAGVDEELRSFEAAWRRRSAAALNTIEADTLSQARRLSRSLRLAWLIPLAAGLGLTLGIFGGSWALTRHLSLEIRDLMLSAQEQRLTLEALEERTGGIVLRRRSEGIFLTVPPAGPWIPAGRSAARPPGGFQKTDSRAGRDDQ